MKYTLLSLCFFIFTLSSAKSHETSMFGNIPMNFTVGSGLINGFYANPIHQTGRHYNGFSVAPSFSAAFEFFTSVEKSWHIKTNISMDAEDGKMRYSYLGGGANYYFGDGNIMASMDEKWIHYAGYDIGLSRIIIIDYGPALNTVSTAADFGGHIGTNYRLNKEWSINAEVGYSYAIGFSTVATNGSNIKSFIGIGHTML